MLRCSDTAGQWAAVQVAPSAAMPWVKNFLRSSSVIKSLPNFLFWTVVLARENVNAKETIEQNAAADSDFQIGL